MCSRSLGLLFLFVMLVLGKPGAYETEDENCTLTINVKRKTEYHIKSGNSAIIECPVRYCQKKPEIKWYKNDNHSHLTLHSGQGHTFKWINDNIFVLNFSSVHKNDSGTYHCESISGNQKAQGHYIKITVQDEDTDDHGTSTKDKTWIVYLFSSLGALGLIAASCLGLLYFIWRHLVKKKTSSVPGNEVNVFNSYSDIKYYNANTTDLPDEGPVLHHGAATPGLKHKHGSSICDSQFSCWKAFRATSNPVHHQSATSIHHFSGEAQDMIVYASLSHEEHSQKSEPSVGIEFTEYATILQKN